MSIYPYQNFILTTYERLCRDNIPVHETVWEQLDKRISKISQYIKALLSVKED